MKFVDSHCHLHDGRIADRLAGIIDRAASVRVKYMVSCATMEGNFDRTCLLAETQTCVLPCLGIHPWFLDSLTPGWEENLAERVLKIPCGIGETGLDFMDRGADRDLQIRVFTVHLNLANDLGRPLNIHIRKGWDALIGILKKTGPLKTPGLVHSYSGSAELVKVLQRYNLYFSFSGAVTRPNARKVVEAVRAVSLDRLLVETDAPDIYPSLESASKGGGQRGKSFPLNEPANLPAIAKIAAQRRGMGFEKFAKTVYDNSLQFFNPLLP